MRDTPELTLENLAAQIEGLAVKIGTIDSDNAKLNSDQSARIQQCEQTVAGLTSQVSDVAATVNALSQSRAAASGDVKPMPGGGQVSENDTGKPLNWGG